MNDRICMPWPAAVLLATCAAACSGAAQASCSIDVLTNPPINFLTPVITIEIDPGKNDGEVLYSGMLQFSSGVGYYWVQCTSSIGLVRGQGARAPINGVVPSAIAGIGYRLRTPRLAIPGEINEAGQVGIRIPRTYSGLFELVKTGPIAAPGFLAPRIGTITVVDHAFTSTTYNFNGPVRVKFKGPTCTVTTPTLLLNAGDVSRTIFSGPNSEAPPGPRGEIRVACAGGAGGSTGVHVLMTDSIDPGNTSSMLGIAGGAGQAQGVKVRLLRDDGSAIIFAPLTTGLPDDAGFWQVGSSMHGDTLSIPLRAQMVQTDAHVEGGAVSAGATFTMSYD